MFVLKCVKFYFPVAGFEINWERSTVFRVNGWSQNINLILSTDLFDRPYVPFRGSGKQAPKLFHKVLFLDEFCLCKAVLDMH